MTTTEILPSVEVASPALVPYPYGLFSVAPAATPADPHFRAGVWWRSVSCGQGVGTTFGRCSVDDDVPALDENVSCDIVTSSAFSVYARSDESTGGGSIADKQGRAREVLLGGEQFAVETMLWSLLQTATAAPAGTADDVLEGIAIAEALIAAAYGGTATLHMGRYAASMAQYFSLKDQGSRLYTGLGANVVAGGGYGTPPTASDPQHDIIATGQLVVMRTDIFDVGQHIDRRVNNIDAVVERTYVVGWDCTALRVHVTPA